MLRRKSVLMLAALATAVSLSGLAEAKDKKKESTFRGCPAGLTFAPDLLKNISWARSVWGFPGVGYRPPKEWKC